MRKITRLVIGIKGNGGEDLLFESALEINSLFGNSYELIDGIDR